MNNVLEYKGYFTVIKVDFERHQLYGKIDGISDLVNFMSDTLSGIEKEFHSAFPRHCADGVVHGILGCDNGEYLL